MKTVSVIAAVAAAALPTIAVAEMSGSIDLGYAVTDADGFSSNLKAPSIEATLAYGAEAGMQVELNVGTKRNSIGDADIDTNSAKLDLGYVFDNGVEAGVFAEDFSVAAGFFGAADFTARGLYVGYSVAGIDGEGYVSSSKIGGDTVNQFGVRGVYSLGDNTALAAELSRATGDGADINYVGLSASHKLNDTFGVFGSAQKISGDFGGSDDLTAVSLGGSYALNGGSVVSLEIARMKRGSAEANVVTLGYSIPLGGAAASMAPADGVTADVAGGTRGAFSKLYDDYFLLLGGIGGPI